jgi:hypothetical protein
MRNAPMTHVLNKQILFHSTVLNCPCLEDYFECFTMGQNENYVLIQGVPVEVSTQTITS